MDPEVRQARGLPEGERLNWTDLPLEALLPELSAHAVTQRRQQANEKKRGRQQARATDPQKKPAQRGVGGGTVARNLVPHSAFTDGVGLSVVFRHEDAPPLLSTEALEEKWRKECVDGLKEEQWLEPEWEEWQEPEQGSADSKVSKRRGTAGKGARRRAPRGLASTSSRGRSISRSHSRSSSRSRSRSTRSNRSPSRSSSRSSSLSLGTEQQEPGSTSMSVEAPARRTTPRALATHSKGRLMKNWPLKGPPKQVKAARDPGRANIAFAAVRGEGAAPAALLGPAPLLGQPSAAAFGAADMLPVEG
ncbi:hypothetical protein DUNSADRAFT_5721 [Dunaliella salina]|uniref:Uncharacterized protein n=1 Tax=Dunaliella salina TaxID=3046 RepID=A0ABQ7FU48_DUNSA|nr:hypothetical protein DUNSADRAFT_5721 [Dunaliella salina]|eukprot:KAF5825945.1 hypothetical protein DUNSADRAFT_5721 [Dunaliella salina]